MVFSRAQEVALLCNGCEVGRLQTGAATLPDLPLSFVFDLSYTPGRLEEVSYTDGVEISRDMLDTTGTIAAVRLIPEGTLYADGHSAAFVRVEMVDDTGRVVPGASVELGARLSGAATLAGFGSAAAVTEDNYSAGRCHTCRGCALAILRGGYTAGEATLTVQAEGLPPAVVTLPVHPAGA